jgi:alpha-1,2-mannosyltransferase
VSTTKGRLAFLLVFLFLYVPFLTTQLFQRLDEPNIDLPSFYFAADVTFNLHQSPYEASSWLALQHELQQRVFPYLYPPPSLLFYWPFSWYSYPTVKTVMLILNHLGLLVLLYLLFFRIFRLPPPWKTSYQDSDTLLPWLILLVLVLYFFKFNPFNVTLYNGQINIIVLIQVCLFWLWLRECRSAALVALPLALAILLKTYPVLFLPVLLIRRRFPVFAWAVGYCFVVTLLSLAVLPAGTWEDWLNSVLPTGGYGKIPFHLFTPAVAPNQSINGFTARLFLNPDQALAIDSVPARWVPTAAAGLLLLALVWVSLRLNRRSPQQKLDEEMVLILLTQFLVAPLSWEHHLVFVLPAALLALIHLLEGRLSGFAASPVALAAGILAWPLPYLFQIQDEGPLSLLISLKFFATVILWLYFLIGLLRSPAAAEPDQG